MRAAQCREGWHLETEPVLEPDEPTEDQKWWVEKRAEAQGMRDQAASDGQDIGDLDELTAELDQEITGAGMRGNVLPARPVRRHRTTRRRQDAAPLPRRKIVARTVGKTYTAPDGKRFRPSMFVTLTCPSYGRVREDGTPADPAAYDYQRAARDALHFAALFDRFVQNLRRFLGCDTSRARRGARTGSATAFSPRNPRPGLTPGACKGKAHRREYLGYAGRRVLVSRKWSGKTLADHRADRKHWLLSTLGVSATDPARYTWEPVTPGDPDQMRTRPAAPACRRGSPAMARRAHPSKGQSRGQPPEIFRHAPRSGMTSLSDEASEGSRRVPMPAAEGERAAEIQAVDAWVC